MRIACIGNMNNIMFQTQRYLVDMGYDTTLFLLDEPNHFNPDADCYFDPKEKYKIVYLGWNIETYINVSKKDIRKALGGFDFYIGTDIAPAILLKIRRRLNLFFPHGTDLFEFPFLKIRNWPPQLWEYSKQMLAIYQFEGIKKVINISTPPTNIMSEEPLCKIRGNAKIVATIPYLYVNDFNDSFFNKSPYLKQIKELKEKSSFLIFHHVSFNTFQVPNLVYQKGNDKLLNGFAGYLKKTNSAKKATLILLEYGDVSKAKKYIDELGISERIVWLPAMKRKDILSIISQIDIGVGELGNLGFILYSVVVEFMSLKKPVIYYRDSQNVIKAYDTLAEIVDTNEVDVVTNTFLDFEANPKKYVDMGVNANLWYLNNIDRVGVQLLKDTIQNSNKSDCKVKSLFPFPLRTYIKVIFLETYYKYLLFKGNIKKKLS